MKPKNKKLLEKKKIPILSEFIERKGVDKNGKQEK